MILITEITNAVEAKLFTLKIRFILKIPFVCVHKCVWVPVCVCLCLCVCRDCPVTGNTAPLLLSDKQQHIVGQLSGGEEGGGSVLLTPG